MLRLLALTTSSVLLASCSCAATAPVAPAESQVQQERTEVRSRREVVRAILPRNVRLLLREEGEVKRTASGVVIASEQTAEGAFSYIVTNAHAVVQGALEAPRLIVSVARGRGEEDEYPADVLAQGEVPDMDLALVRASGVALPAAELASDEEFELGEDVVVAASPYGKALSVSGGLLSQVEWDRETRTPKMVKTDAPIGYGSSGGGIFSATTGRLLAIVEGYRTARVGFAVGDNQYGFDVPMPGETFAAPTSKLRRFLQAHGFGRLAGLRDAPVAAPAASPEATPVVEARR